MVFSYTSEGDITMRYKAMDIARYIVNKCVEDNRPVSNLQLQKILYYVQINFMRLLSEPAFDDEIEAWQYGPVVPEVYYEFADCGGTDIYRTYPSAQNLFRNNNEKQIVDKVITLCLRLNPWELVERTHRPNTPWARVYKGFPDVIPNEYLYEYAKR